MRKFGLPARFGVLALLLVCGCGGSKPKYTDAELALIPAVQKDGLPEASGGFVLAVGDETITSDEIITEPLLNYYKPIAQKSSFEKFEKQAGPELEQIITTKVSNILLYQQAKREAGEGVDIEAALEKATESETRSFIASFDGDYIKAEQALKKMGMNWTSFREYQKKMILSQDYIRRQLPERRPITRSELVACYNEMKDEFFALPTTITFRLIDIEPSKLEVTDPNVSRVEQARKLAQELMRRLQSREDFGELAKQYSHGYTASDGGLWRPVQPGSLAKPYDVLAVEAEKIESGQVAGPIEADEHIFIMKLEEKKAGGFEPLDNVQKEVESKILFGRREIASDQFAAGLAKQIAMGERDRFLNFCLKKIYRLSNQ